jgi:excisionase family DNA binding protein
VAVLTTPNIESPRPRLLKITEAADEINVTERTVRAMIKDGRLKASRAGRIIRINSDDLDAAFKPYGGSVDADGGGA